MYDVRDIAADERTLDHGSAYRSWHIMSSFFIARVPVGLTERNKPRQGVVANMVNLFHAMGSLASSIG